MTGWIWVVVGGERCYVQILCYRGNDDVYIVKFANGDTAKFAGNDVFEWNKGA